MIRKIDNFEKLSKLGAVAEKVFKKTKKLQIDDSRYVISASQSEERIVKLEICIATFLALLASILTLIYNVENLNDTPQKPLTLSALNRSLYFKKLNCFRND